MTTISFQPYAPGTSDSVGNRIGSIDPRLSRTNYFDGQLLKASDLTRDQIYLDERLLEMGLVLGSGISQGLEVELIKNQLLRLHPGIAVAPSGRVLQLSGKTLEIDLQDSGFIADLNQGLYRRFNRGLYAVALKYAEVVDGVAESYPADLASRRSWQVSSYAEGVELTLIPLNINLPRGDDLAMRAALAQQFIAAGNSFVLPSDEAIALGLLAIDQARPLWLDLGLLRRPLRRVNTGNALQLDLATHYQELFGAVQTARENGGRLNDFAASSYFRVLPPFGPLPKGAIDPVTGRQGYFPKDYEVAIAPVRRADLAAIIEESAHLAPMDMQRDADADIMVLVPMSDQAFAMRARQLEKSAQKQLPVINKLPWFGGLALRLFTQPPAHLIDTDADAWKAIWDEANADELIYVRRPPRTAETNVSAVVLARGFELPEISKQLPPDPASLEAQLDTALDESVAAKAKLEQAKAKIGALEEKIKQLEQSLGSDVELNEALAQVQTLKAELAAAEEQLKALQAGTEDAAVLKTALAAATDKITKLAAELELALKKIAELEAGGNSTDADSQEKIKALTDALDAANSQAAALKDECNATQLKLAEAELRLKNLTAELEQLKKKLDELSSGATSSDSDMAAAKEEIAKLNATIKALTEQQRSLEAQLLKAQQAQAAAENDSKNATLKLSDALKVAQEAQALSTAQALELSKNKELLAALQTQLAAAEKKSADLQLQLAQRISIRSTFPLVELAKMRGGDTNAAEKLESQVADNNSARLAVVHLLTLTPAQFDKALWPSLVSVAQEPKNLPQLRDVIQQMISQGVPVGNAYFDNGAQLGMTTANLRTWKSLIS